MAGPVNIQTLTYPPPPSALPPSTPSNSTPHSTGHSLTLAEAKERLRRLVHLGIGKTAGVIVTVLQSAINYIWHG